MNVKELISQLENKVEVHLNLTIERFQNLDQDLLNKPAKNNGWSIALCLEHLNTYGDHYLPLIEQSIHQADHVAGKEFKSGWLGKYFTSMMDADQSEKKYKAITKHIPNTMLSAHQIVARFIDQQEKMMELLKKCENKDLNNIKITTSIHQLIKLKLGDVLQFLIVHNDRHMKQAMRNLY